MEGSDHQNIDIVGQNVWTKKEAASNMNWSKFGEAPPIDEIYNLRNCLVKCSCYRQQILQKFDPCRFTTIHYISYGFNKYCRNLQKIRYISNCCSLQRETYTRTGSPLCTSAKPKYVYISWKRYYKLGNKWKIQGKARKKNPQYVCVSNESF